MNIPRDDTLRTVDEYGAQHNHLHKQSLFMDNLEVFITSLE